MWNSRTRLAASIVAALSAISAFFLLAGGSVAAGAHARPASAALGQHRAKDHGADQARPGAACHHRDETRTRHGGTSGPQCVVPRAASPVAAGARADRKPASHAAPVTPPDTATAGRAPPA